MTYDEGLVVVRYGEANDLEWNGPGLELKIEQGFIVITRFSIVKAILSSSTVSMVLFVGIPAAEVERPSRKPKAQAIE